MCSIARFFPAIAHSQIISCQQDATEGSLRFFQLRSVAGVGLCGPELDTFSVGCDAGASFLADVFDPVALELRAIFQEVGAFAIALVVDVEAVEVLAIGVSDRDGAAEDAIGPVSVERPGGGELDRLTVRTVVAELTGDLAAVLESKLARALLLVIDDGNSSLSSLSFSFSEIISIVYIPFARCPTLISTLF